MPFYSQKSFEGLGGWLVYYKQDPSTSWWNSPIFLALASDEERAEFVRRALAGHPTHRVRFDDYEGWAVFDVPLRSLGRGPRRPVDAARLQRLVDDLRIGVLPPPLIVGEDADGRLRVLDGLLRLRGLRRLRRVSYPCVVGKRRIA